MNNKSGQTAMLAVLFAAMFFLLGIIFINYIRPDVQTAQSTLDCNNTSTISDGTKLMCLITDGVVPYFIILVLSSAGGVILSRLAI